MPDEDRTTFFRTKVADAHAELQIVETYRTDGRVRQLVVASLGRLERDRDGGGLDWLLRSAARFTDRTLALVAGGEAARGDPASATTVSIRGASVRR